MLRNAVKTGRFLIYALIFSAAFLVSNKVAFATQYQQCAADSTCTVGEFLYDDEYQVITTGASCTITSYLPSGDLLINEASMIGTSDGWYYYDVGTSGLSNGIYPTRICCLTDSETICLDKTFEVTSTLSSIASDVWSSPNRSLTSFGDLISNIWSFSSKTLSSATLDDGSTLATTDSLGDIGSTLTDISDQLNNVQADIVTIDSKIDTLQAQVDNIYSDTTNILAKWGSYSQSDIINYVDSLETQLGSSSDVCGTDDTVFGSVDCLIEKWGSQTALSLYTAANNAYITASSLRSEIGFNGKTTTAYEEMVAIKAYVDTIESSIGSSSDTSSASTIFGKIAEVKEAIEDIDSTSLDLDDLLAKWDDLSAGDIYDRVDDLSDEISAINTVSNVNSILNIGNSNTTTIDEIQNQVFAMQALLEANRILLEKIDNQPVITSWLENGSVIFKSLITNPSSTITQETSFVYYLPSEVKEEDIIQKSDSLTIKYDTSQGVLYATGDFTLKAKETVMVEIEVEDIWSISQEQIDSLRQQSDELFSALDGTSYYAQGATLHADINASLDRIIEIQKESDNPEEKIKNYRDAEIELESVNKKMDSLKEVVSSAGSIGTLSGFIGGVQTLGVWGIMVVLVAGFVFLALYIKSLNSKKKQKIPEFSPIIESETITETKSTPESEAVPKSEPASEPLKDNPTPCATNTATKTIQKKSKTLPIFVLLFITSFAIFGVIGYFLFKNQLINSNNTNVLSAVDQISDPTPTVANSEVESTDINTIDESSASASVVTPTITPTPTGSAEKRAILSPLTSDFVNVRADSSTEAEIIEKLATGTEVNIVNEKYNDDGEKWVMVSSGQTEGWVFEQLIEYIEEDSGEVAGVTDTVTVTATPTSTDSNSTQVKINVPSHDVVFVYSKPSYSASISYKISESQIVDILLETESWAKIFINNANIDGWVSKDFIEKNY